MRQIIVDMFPAEYSRYIEVFGGAGWVLFYRSMHAQFEVYNDFNSNLTTLFRMVRDEPEALISSLEFVLNSREDFEISRKLLNEKTDISDVMRASHFFRVIKYSYGAGCDSYGGHPVDISRSFDLIRMCSHRLKRVVIENRDFGKLIEQYDRSQSLFFCDPPYYGTENYYDDVGFTKDNHFRLREILGSIKGKFILTYNDCPFIRELYNGYYICAVDRVNSLALRSENYEPYHELIITNYDPNVESHALMQTSLFE